jgi:hypothetical protein
MGHPHGDKMSLWFVVLYGMGMTYKKAEPMVLAYP